MFCVDSSPSLFETVGVYGSSYESMGPSSRKPASFWDLGRGPRGWHTLGPQRRGRPSSKSLIIVRCAILTHGELGLEHEAIGCWCRPGAAMCLADCGARRPGVQGSGCTCLLTVDGIREGSAPCVCAARGWGSVSTAWQDNGKVGGGGKCGG